MSQGNGETLASIVQQNSYEASRWAVDEQLRGFTVQEKLITWKSSSISWL